MLSNTSSCSMIPSSVFQPYITLLFLFASWRMQILQKIWSMRYSSMFVNHFSYCLIIILPVLRMNTSGGTFWFVYHLTSMYTHDISTAALFTLIEHLYLLHYLLLFSLLFIYSIFLESNSSQIWVPVSTHLIRMHAYYTLLVITIIHTPFLYNVISFFPSCLFL